MNEYQSQKVIVKCNICKKQGIITILNGLDGSRVVDWSKSEHPPIISARFRLDSKWGFECICGNSNILADEEKGIITGKKPSRKDINEVVDKLKNNLKNKSKESFTIKEV